MEIENNVIKFWLNKAMMSGERRFLKLSDALELAIEPITVPEYDEDTDISYDKTIGHRVWAILHGRYTKNIIGGDEFTYKNTPDDVIEHTLNFLKSL